MKVLHGVMFFVFCLFFSFFHIVHADFIPVEDVFSDVDVNYKYYKELQELYNRGMIFPESDGKFHGEKLLERDEFVGISMEVICKKCIQPHTEDYFIDTYSGKYIFFDIDEKNKYFYCVAEADAKDYVRGYDKDYVCENGTSKSGEKPFCPSNKITKEEAYAVIMRNSKIWTIQDNEQMLSQIQGGTAFPQISDDVGPRNTDGSPYTFYGYFKKALDYQITEYDKFGEPTVYKLLTPIGGKIYPKKYVTKEEFLYMAYIALKANNCKDSGIKNNLALDMDILDKTCQSTDKDCSQSDLKDPDDTYDFKPIVEGYCEAGIQDPEGYIWRFYNMDTGERIIRYGKYIDNFQLPHPGVRRIYLRVVDKCGNTGEIFSTIVVHEIEGLIEIYDDTCNQADNCEDTTVFDDPKDTYDIDIPIEVTCEEGIKSYYWTITHVASGETYHRTTPYVDDFVFTQTGEWQLNVLVTDNCNNTVNRTRSIIIDDIDGPIEVYDKDCIEGDSCSDIDRLKDPDDTYDIDIPIEVTCSAGVKSYYWTIIHVATGDIYHRNTQYVDNFVFNHSGDWELSVVVTDNCGNTLNRTRHIIIDDLDGDIEILDKSCTEGSGCTPTTLDDPDDTYDIDIPVDVSCEAGVKSYNWTVEHLDSGEKFYFNTRYINNFRFSKYGEWQISVKVEDNCGNSIIRTKRITIADIGLNVTVIADPIIGYGPLLVDFEGFATGGDGKYTYTWDFADGGKGTGKIIDHVFTDEGVYLVKLHVVDGEGRTGDATVLIKVLPKVCTEDSDGDGVFDCDDLCPYVKGELINKGCPVLERECNEECGCPAGYVCESQDRATCVNSYCRPIVVVNNFCLFDQKSDTIFGNIVCNTCPCNRFVDFLADLRKCDVLFPAITSPNSQEIYSRGNIYTIIKK